MSSLEHSIREARDWASRSAGVRCEPRLAVELARLHAQAFPGFFLTGMGEWFLREYYHTVLTYELGLTLVAVQRETIIGFAAGFLDPSGFYSHLRHRSGRFLWATARAVIRRPAMVPRVLAGVGRMKRKVPAAADSASVCELASLAVSPEAEGRGLGRALVAAFAEAARAQGAARIELTTDAHENERVNRFYRSLGFVPGKLEERGQRRLMQHYSLDLSGDGASPPSR